MFFLLYNKLATNKKHSNFIAYFGKFLLQNIMLIMAMLLYIFRLVQWSAAEAQRYAWQRFLITLLGLKMDSL